MTQRSNIFTDLPVVALQPVAEALADKAEWRAWARRTRRAMNATARAHHAAQVAESVAALAERLNARRVALYAPLGAEVDTRPLANRLIAEGRALAYPRLREDGVVMDFVACEGPAYLRQRPRSRLLEPVGAPLDPAELDLVVAPALAVDAALVRLGQGGGSYDRYLPLLRPEAVTVALVSAQLCAPWGPKGTHDRAVDLVCTEDGLRKAHS